MKALLLLVPCLLLAACGDGDRVKSLEERINATATRVNELERRNDDLALKLEAATRPAPAPHDNSAEIAALQTRLAGLEQRIAELESTPAAPQPAEDAPAPQPVPDDKPADADNTAPAAPADAPAPAADMRRLDELLPLVKSSHGDEVYELVEVAEKSNKAFRDELIKRMQDWVTAEPENHRARLGLALALTTRFRDIRGDMMKQATLAGEVRKEAEKAQEIDPDFYDAVHFMAILKVNYPPFAQEFQSANKDLDRALEMQAQLPWDDSFCEIYAAYSMWYRKQNKLDEAMAKVNAGLQKAPQNNGLLNEKKLVEAARNQPGE